MTTAEQSRRQTARKVMLAAWSFRQSEPARGMSDCLTAAWRWVRGMAKTAAKFMAKARRNGGRVNYGSPVHSPLQRATAGERYAVTADRKAAQMTGRVGW